MEKKKPKPVKPCWNCGLNKWWQRADGEWICQYCHPKPFEEHRVALPTDNFI